MIGAMLPLALCVRFLPLNYVSVLFCRFAQDTDFYKTLKLLRLFDRLSLCKWTGGVMLSS